MRGMRGRDRLREYGWADAQEELEEGIHPAVVAARLGEPEDFVIEVAGQRGWPVVWEGGPTAEDVQIANRLDS